MGPPTQSVTGRIGEVISANSTAFVVQCYELYGAPGIGSFVRAGSPGIYGVVYDVRTEPLDPSRPVLARGQDAETEDEIYLDNPQIARLLTSRFDAAVIGLGSEGGFEPVLPSLPPRVHSFVYACLTDETSALAGNLAFLRRLVRSESPASDDVVRACILVAASTQPDPQALTLRAGRLLAAELSSDLPRINAILGGIPL